LPNIKKTPKELNAYESDKTNILFEETGVFTRREAHARHEILLDAFYKKLQIEARVIGELGMNVIIPAAIAYQSRLVENAVGLKELGLSKDTYKAQLDIINKIAEHVNIVKADIEEMVEARKKANTIENMRDKAIEYDEKVKPFFQSIRYHADKLEQLVDDSLWPLPKFRELLFIK